MSHRTDTVRSIALIAGSAFAAIGLTAFVIMARENPAEQAPAETGVMTVSVPATLSGSVVGKARAYELRVGNRLGERGIVVTGASGALPAVYIDGVRMEGTRREALQGIDPADIDGVEVVGEGAASERVIRVTTRTGGRSGSNR